MPMLAPGHRSPGRHLVVLGFLVAGLVAGCGSSPVAGPVAAGSTQRVGETTYPVRDRRPAPDLSGTTLDGRLLSLRTLGPAVVVVINVWASWCGPCRTESPVLASEARALQGHGVRFLGLDEEDRTAAARAYAVSAGEIYPSLVDHDGALLRRLTLLPPQGIPSTLVLDSSGRVAARVIGMVTRAQLQRIVTSLEPAG
jgi:thiol-disulfide isomerase/thioredoxin